ncbi:hypothetical protein P0J98_001074, partial [Campylobacter coli]|nr:hypothetical protein [Campylobacter coli]
QAVQATNDLLAYQIDEIRKLRSVIMDQSNMLTNYLASQNNEKILDDAKCEPHLLIEVGASLLKPTNVS